MSKLDKFFHVFYLVCTGFMQMVIAIFLTACILSIPIAVVIAIVAIITNFLEANK